MLKRNNFWLGAVLATGLAVPTWAGETTADTIVATVNGENITIGHMIATKGTLPEQYQTLADDVLFPGILDQLIQQAVLSQAMQVDQPKRITLILENELRAQRAAIVLDGKLADIVTEEAVQSAYEAQYAGITPDTEYNASHILVETEDEAKEIRKLLDEGADFVELAKEKSTGPSGPNGGDLGWFSKGMMVKPFEDAVLSMEAGGVSDPVKTQFGWHVLILDETRLMDAPSLDSVRAELEAGIQEAAVKSVIGDLTEAANIVRPEEGSVAISALSDNSLIDN